MDRKAKISISFVCLGNICRSPTAEAVMRDLVAKAGLAEKISVESAGTGDWHVGHAPDPRSMAAASRRGIRMTSRARQFQRTDFDRLDYVLAMDQANYDNLVAMAPPGVAGEKLRLLRSFDPASPRGSSVPDPYYTTDGFDEVIDLCIAACEPLLAHVKREHGLGQ
jgi:protein-tyrosine phosphatase